MSPAKVETPRPRLSEAMTAWLDTLGPNRTATLHALAVLGAAHAGLDLSAMADELDRIQHLPQLPAVLVTALTRLHATLGTATLTPVPAPARHQRRTPPKQETRVSRQAPPAPADTAAVADALVEASVVVPVVQDAALDNDFDLGFSV